MSWIKRKPVIEPRKSDSFIEKIAKIRGIKDVDDFLHPTEESLIDPYLMKNIEKAASRIISAIENGEKIVVSYDPDSDGITSGTIMMRYLRNYTENVDYIYGERSHGHGIAEMIKVNALNSEKDKERIEHNKSNTDKIRNADLLVLIDSSSNDVKACRFIKEKLHTDIIVLDHHSIEEHNPHVLMVNPQQEDCMYPNKYLSGAGVVFKTIQVMEDTLQQVDVWRYIDLVAVGLHGDMMKVDVPENRYLITKGLQNIKNTGLIRILKGAKADFFKLNGDSIGFSISPLINATARMDNIKMAIDILLEDDDNVCKKLRLQMHKMNEQRKEIQKETLEKYMKCVDESKKILIVMDDYSNKGFNGLISQQLTDTYKRPAIVGRLHEGVLSGSYRSYNSFNLQKFLIESNLVEEAKGHPQAGGVVIKEENLQELMDYIEEFLPELTHKGQTIIYDIEIDAKDVIEHISDIEKLNFLTGNGFRKVLLKVNGVTVEEQCCIGKTQETVKITTLDDMEMIKFKVNKDYAAELGFFDIVDVIGELKMNEFYHFGKKEKISTPQIVLADYKSI